jgi:fimbrial chaperone protein
VTELNAGTRILENALVPPMGKTSVKLPADAGTPSPIGRLTITAR